MTSWTLTDVEEIPAPPPRRVRHLVRDGVAVIAFSASASVGLALALTLLTRVAG